MKRQRVSAPIAFVAILASIVIVAPVVALLARVPWGHLLSELSSEDSLKALRVSLFSSLLATLFAVALGVPLAWLLARGPSSVTKYIRPLVTLPLVLPPTVAGLALLALMGRNGVVGSWIYEATGWAMPFTFIAVVVAGVFVGMPFLVLVVESGFAQLPQEIEEAAETDGANANQLFLNVAVPQVRGSIVTGAILAWARALGEFGATLTFAGSMPGITRTLPMQVYVALESNVANAYALSVVLVVVSVTVLYVMRSHLMAVFRNV